MDLSTYFKICNLLPMVIFCVLWSCEAAPVVTCNDGTLVKTNCICSDDKICTGSHCSIAVRNKPKDGESSKVSGYHISGAHACLDCTCHDKSPRKAPVARLQETAPFELFIGIKTGTPEQYQKRRMEWRNSKCAELYEAAGWKYKFFVGHPQSQNHQLWHHSQGGFDTDEERKSELHLFEEQKIYKDMEFIPFRDQYMDISNKLLNLLRFGYYHTSARYIMEHDDEYCMKVDVIKDIIKKFESNKKDPETQLYAGNYLWQGHEYDSMKGVEGLVAPYFSGWGSFMSRGLVKSIVETDAAHSILFGLYGTVMDDSNTGKWVQYAQNEHNMKVDFVSKPMVVETGKLGAGSKQYEFVPWK
eukprot:m.341769 g.341769  ORF g.341769 m.341769 type:complete len:358 (+) comp20488_c0_seq1:225-1298(+)